MALFPIRTFGDPVLNVAAARVDDISSALERLVDDMLETMYDAPGLGLAAPQIGVSKRIFVADIGEGPFTMINPEIVDLSDDEWPFEEGCLSVPGWYWSLDRPSYAAARGIGLDGNPVEYAGDELMGRVLQHEIDHLDGSLLLGRLPKRARKSALRDLRREALGFDVGTA
ncbi:MAG: peptide deformylase [Acidimicrobiia bacterium]|nr:peptide deformylase [Acidimicrobiia bacterium]